MNLPWQPLYCWMVCVYTCTQYHELLRQELTMLQSQQLNHRKSHHWSSAFRPPAAYVQRRFMQLSCMLQNTTSPFNSKCTELTARGKGTGLTVETLQVQLSAVSLLCNVSRQDVHMHVLMTCYQEVTFWHTLVKGWRCSVFGKLARNQHASHVQAVGKRLKVN